MSYVSFENIDNLEVYLTDLDSGDKTVVTEDIDFLSLGLLESHRLNITNSKSEISSVKKDKKIDLPERRFKPQSFSNFPTHVNCGA